MKTKKYRKREKNKGEDLEFLIDLVKNASLLINNDEEEMVLKKE